VLSNVANSPRGQRQKAAAAKRRQPMVTKRGALYHSMTSIPSPREPWHSGIPDFSCAQPMNGSLVTFPTKCATPGTLDGTLAILPVATLWTRPRWPGHGTSPLSVNGLAAGQQNSRVSSKMANSFDGRWPCDCTLGALADRESSLAQARSRIVDPENWTTS
jgi:hypothetical protein